MSWLRDRVQTVDRRLLQGRLWLWYHSRSWNRYRRILRLTERPILIGGCGRSGTSLLLSQLSCHPRIFAIAEETNAFCPGGYRPEADRDVDFHIEVIYDHLLRHSVPDWCTRWCEKTPKNVIYVDRLLDYFGNEARFLNIVRDGRDVVTSTHPHDPGRYWIPPERWVLDVSAGRRAETHPQVLTIRYEDLVRDYKGMIQKVCSFIGEEVDRALLRYPEAATVRSSKAWFGGATAVHQQSVRRWENPIHQTAVRNLMAIPEAVELMRHYQYLE